MPISYNFNDVDDEDVADERAKSRMIFDAVLSSSRDDNDAAHVDANYKNNSF